MRSTNTQKLLYSLAAMKATGKNGGSGLNINASSIVSAGKIKDTSIKNWKMVIEAIGGDAELAVKAAKMAVDKNNRKKLFAAIGRKLPDNFHMAVGRTVAAMGLHCNNPNCGAAKKAEPIIAALLQEFVAYEVIDIETVRKEFGNDVASLTEELAKVTYLPVNLKMPDEEGRLSVLGIRHNKEQFEYARELIHATSKPAVSWMIKIADALQQLRCLDGIPDREDRILAAMRIQGMYFPMVVMFGLDEVKKEMEQSLLHILDPKTEEAIASGLKKWIQDGFSDKVKNGLSKAISVAGGEFVNVALTQSRKTPWSIWQKLLHDRYKSEVERIKEEKRLLLLALEKGEIGKTEFRSELKKIRAREEGNPIPVIGLEKIDLAELHDVDRFRIVIDDVIKITRRGERIIDDEGNIRKVEAIAKSVSDNFCERAKEREIYHINPRKSGYRALHVICSPKGEKLGRRFEVQITAKSWHAENEKSHKIYKFDFCNDSAGLGVERESLSYEEKLSLIDGTTGELSSLLKGGNVCKRRGKYVYVSDVFRNITRLKSGATGYALILKLVAMASKHAGRCVDYNEYLSGIKEISLNRRYISVGDFLKRPLINADALEFKLPKCAMPSLLPEHMKLQGWNSGKKSAIRPSLG